MTVAKLQELAEWAMKHRIEPTLNPVDGKLYYDLEELRRRTMPKKGERDVLSKNA
jgi:hypothetical protein